MLILVFTVLLATVFALFATQNTTSVSLTFLGYAIPNIPVYLAVLFPFLIGLLVSFLFHMAKDLSSSLTINEEKGRIKNLKKELAEVTKQAHQFEIENAKLKTQTGEPDDENSI